MAAILEDGKLRLSGYVGDYYFEDGFTSGDVVLALAAIDEGADLAVHINSGGGIASEGAAIHALLSNRKGTTDVVVEGIAASAASLIAMAGETVTMSAGAVMMIHDPSGITWGTSADHSKTIEGLEAHATAYSRVYAAKSGKSADECRAIMKAERWLTPQQAVEEGFADDTTEEKGSAVAAFDYRIYAHAPKRLTALASKKNWRLEEANKRAAPAAASAGQPHKETNMPGKNDGGDTTAETAVAAYKALRKSVMALPEAKGREALADMLIDMDMSEDQIKAALAAAPLAVASEAEDESGKQEGEYQPRRMNAAGLNKTAANGKPEDKSASRTILTASVDRLNKRR